MLKYEIVKGNPEYLFWMFVHNAIVHPMMAFPIQFDIVNKWHDWTAEKCWGHG